MTVRQYLRRAPCRSRRALTCVKVWEMSDARSDDAVPEEIEEQCLQCHHALAGIDRLLKPILATGRHQLNDKLDTLDAASLTLLLTYTMNSLFWVYLATQGANPKTHPMKKELERVQKAMQRAKFIGDKKRGAGPKVNKDAAKRFVRSALWEDGGSQAGPSRKRKLEDAETESASSASKRTHQ